MEPLFANGDLGKLVVALIIAAFYLVSYVIKASNEAKAARQERERALHDEQETPQDVYTPRQGRPARQSSDSFRNSRASRAGDRNPRAGQTLEAVPQTGGLTQLQSSLPSREAFDGSEPLATPTELTGLNTDLLPSDHMDRIYHDATAATGSAPRQTSNFASDLLRMFSSPQSMQQAVLLAEIMKRPDFDTPAPRHASGDATDLR